MRPETKQQALAKLATFKRKIGYPDKLRGYQGLTIDRKSYRANMLRSASFRSTATSHDIGKPARPDALELFAADGQRFLQSAQ